MCHTYLSVSCPTSRKGSVTRASSASWKGTDSEEDPRSKRSKPTPTSTPIPEPSLFAKTERKGKISKTIQREESFGDILARVVIQLVWHGRWFLDKEMEADAVDLPKLIDDGLEARWFGPEDAEKMKQACGNPVTQKEVRENVRESNLSGNLNRWFCLSRSNQRFAPSAPTF